MGLASLEAVIMLRLLIKGAATLIVGLVILFAIWMALEYLGFWTLEAFQ